MLPAQEEWESDFCAIVDQETAAPFLRAKELSNEISIMNLVNGLYLTRDQMGRIIDLSSRARERIAKALQEHQRKGKEFECVLDELRMVLKDPDQRIPESLEARVHELERDLREVKERVKRELKAMEDEMVGFLSPGQMEVIQEFNPCLIPPKNLKDPLRVGQAGGEQAEIEMHIEHLRNLPERPYCVLIDALLEKMVDEWNHIFHFSPEERREELARLRGIADEARSLADAEFAIKKAGLARRVMQRFDEFHEQANDITDFFARMGALSKAGKWLLNPRIIPILEERMKAAPPGLSPTVACGGSCSACEDPASCASGSQSDLEAGFCRCGKPTFGWFCTRFDISPEHREAVREIIGKGQVRLLDLLCEKTDEGEVPLVLLFTRPGCLEEILACSVPGKGTTYWIEAASIMGQVHLGLRSRMSREAFREMKSTDFDLFELHVGNLNEYDNCE